MEQRQDIELHLPEDTVRALVQRIRGQRLQKTWTQQQLADRAGIPVRTYRHFERTGQITFARFIYVLIALGCADQLVKLVPEPQHRTIRDLKRPRKRGKRSDATLAHRS